MRDFYTEKYGFTIGDKVLVTDSFWTNLPVGSIHTVYDIYKNNGEVLVAVTANAKAQECGYFISRFIKYEESKENTVQENKKINPEKKYRMVNTHEPIRVICTDRKDPVFPCIGLYASKDGSEGVIYFSNIGKNSSGRTVIEEVPPVDWSAVKVDAPVWIKVAGWVVKRHFNKFEDGKVHYWPDGWTSFTCSQTCSINCVDVEDAFLEEPK